MLNITQYEQLEKAYGKTLREIASDSDSWKRFLDSAGYTYRQSFKNQVAMYSQKPGMKAVLTEKRWEDMNRAVKSGTTGRLFLPIRLCAITAIVCGTEKSISGVTLSCGNRPPTP